MATSTSPVAGGPYGTSCTGAVDANYTIIYAPGSLTETKAAQSITFVDHPPTNATYGGTFTVSATSSSGQSVTFSTSTSSVCAVSGTTVTFTGVGTCTVIASQSGSANYLAAPQVTQGISVAKAPVTVVAAPVSIVRSILTVSVTFSATLTSQTTGKGISGQVVTFSDGPLATCSGTTNASGVATCTVSVLAVVALLFSPSFSAAYAGGTDYVASTTTGKVTL
jgi:hypothetical protein